MIYLDNAATTFPKPEEVYETVDYAQRNLAVNVGRGSYHVANEAMKIVDETRYLLAKLVRIDDPNNVILTSSATIAANEIIMGLKWDNYKVVYITPFEHNAIARPLNYIKEKYGIKICFLPFNSNTQEFDIGRARVLFSKEKPDYVFINHVSNVTGTVTPIKEISELVKEYDGEIILDASQSLGLFDIDFNRDKIDYLIFAGHKNLYASFGIGGFICNTRAKIQPALFGGTGSDSLNLSMGNTSPVSYEPGSPNIVAIASLNTALKWLDKVDPANILRKETILCSKLLSGLKEIGCTLYMPSINCEHGGIVSFNVEGYTADEVGSILDEEFDIAVRTGYHCAPYIHDFLGTKKYGGTVRVSLSYFNNEDDVMSLISAIKDL